MRRCRGSLLFCTIGRGAVTYAAAGDADPNARLKEIDANEKTIDTNWTAAIEGSGTASLCANARLKSVEDGQWCLSNTMNIDTATLGSKDIDEGSEPTEPPPVAASTSRISEAREKESDL